ncbi:amidase family protein [Mycoplasma wenyonii]|uniref:amidase family protein n=1 Tax=Mycoplasma wenyonii TaxID=65123 RepID=UPI0035E42510
METDPNWEKGAIEILKNIRKKRVRALLFPSRKKPVKSLVYSLKNSIYIKDKLSSGGSNALLTHFPPFSSTIYKKLFDAGAVHICSSALDEFGMGGAGVFCNTGLLSNPHDENRVCGGSSSGGAYLVSKGLVDFAIGTDTGGSIRTPASYTSLYGFKPSFGLVSREGILPLCTLLDTPSIISTSVEIIARVLSVISGSDPLDLTTLKSQQKAFHKFPKPKKLLSTYKSEDKPKKLSFVVLDELQRYPEDRTLSQQETKIKESYSNLINRLNQDSSCELFSETLGKIPLDLAELTYKIIAYSEAITHYFSLNGLVVPWSNLQVSDVSFNSKFPVDKKYQEKAREIREKMGREVQLRHLIGYFFLYQSNYQNIYLKARRLMSAYSQNMKRILSEGKILISPTTPTIAPLLENFSNSYQVDNCSSVLLLSNFSGTPAISIPWLEYEAKYYEKTSTVYVGLHLTAKRGEDHYLLSAIKYLETKKLL